jgi:tRNA(Ile)-lysidine synthase
LPLIPDTLADRFAAAMDRLGPLEPAPAVAVAVSGGADSMALAVLARDWIGRRGGSVHALIVDHGLRAASADEARITVQRLTDLGISARVLFLADLKRGRAMAERARISRYQVLIGACAEAGVLHLLLGHHAADQAETVAMRVLRGSHTSGLAGMAALHETARVRLLRPLLQIPPPVLRQFLAARGIGWVEDPSNQDLRALRPRLRNALIPNAAVAEAASTAGRTRRRAEEAAALELALRATIRPEGFALVLPGRISTQALRALLRAIGGADYAASPSQVAALAARLVPATVAGVRLMPAGRLGDGMLMVREEAAISPPAPAVHGMVWDGRFRVTEVAGPAAKDATVGKLGDDAARFRRRSDLPAAILRTMPAIRLGEVLASVPHLRYDSGDNNLRMTVSFAPGRPVAGPSFLPAV